MMNDDETRSGPVNHRSAALVRATRRLHAIMARLRRECPWDREQSPASLRRYLIEECHEVLDALDREDPAAVRDELGDLALQIVFHAEMASEVQGATAFDLVDVLEALAAKLIRRHPHVFGAGSARDVAAVAGVWERAKRAEGRRSRLDGLPPLLPAALRAQKVQEKAARVGFDWPELSGVWAKLDEERGELEAELAAASQGVAGADQRIAAEYGDLLFTMVNLGRHLGVNAEDALREASGRFEARFRAMEREAETGVDLERATPEQLEAAWERAKERLSEEESDRPKP